MLTGVFLSCTDNHSVIRSWARVPLCFIEVFPDFWPFESFCPLFCYEPWDLVGECIKWVFDLKLSTSQILVLWTLVGCESLQQTPHTLQRLLWWGLRGTLMGDNAPPRIQRVPNRKLNVMCGILLSCNKCVKDSQENASCCHWSWLPSPHW